MNRAVAASAALLLLLASAAAAFGPPPPEQRDLIHRLAGSHEKISREVELTDDGYVARTTSADAEVAGWLKSHVTYMKERMGSGAPVRRWDPAFEEMFRHHGDLTVEITELDDGLRVTVRGATPEAIAVARNHATIISGFAELGFEAVQRTHAVALAVPAPTAPAVPHDPGCSHAPPVVEHDPDCPHASD